MSRTVRILGITLDPAGDLLVADADLDVVRALAASNGTRYGVKMSKGRVYLWPGESATTMVVMASSVEGA